MYLKNADFAGLTNVSRGCSCDFEDLAPDSCLDVAVCECAYKHRINKEHECAELADCKDGTPAQCSDECMEPGDFIMCTTPINISVDK
jgi:hypothetical protein